LNSPCYETPKNAIKKNRAKRKTNEGKNKKTEEKKAEFFVMSPDGFFPIPKPKKFYRVFLTPLVAKRPKTRLKKSIKK
jgi:hypothetical protein